MKIALLVVGMVVSIAVGALQRRFPQLHKPIGFLWNIVYSLVVTIYCGYLMYGVYKVLTSGVSAGDKTFFVIFVGICVSVLVLVVIFTWVRWVKKRKNSR